jgi:hypothetical protein
MVSVVVFDVLQSNADLAGKLLAVGVGSIAILLSVAVVLGEFGK